MNNSTQDSQELIEGLGKAGGGLSNGRAFSSDPIFKGLSGK